VTVTRVAYSRDLNSGKLAVLAEQARRLGQVRALVWRRYGSLGGVGLGDRQVRDRWMADGTAAGFGVLANAWKETLRDAIGDIRAGREAAKVKVRLAIFRRTTNEAERKRLYLALKADAWTSEPYLSRMMRKHWRHGCSRVANQIVVRADDYRTYVLTEGGNVWLSIPGLEPRRPVRIPLDSTVAPSGTLRVILRGGRAEIHYQADGAAMKSSARPHGDQVIGVDKGFTEVLTDSGGMQHGLGLGTLLAARIVRNNLGTAKKDQAHRRFEAKVRTMTFEAVHTVVDKASTVVAEDLTKTFASRRKPGRDMNRRLASWTKGVTAEALESVSERRGSGGPCRCDQHPEQVRRPRHHPVDPAYAGQADPSGTDRSPPGQTAGPGLQLKKPGSGERNIHTLQPTRNSEEAEFKLWATFLSSRPGQSWRARSAWWPRPTGSRRRPAWPCWSRAAMPSTRRWPLAWSCRSWSPT
jgi:hypothetical protein